MPHYHCNSTTTGYNTLTQAEITQCNPLNDICFLITVIYFCVGPLLLHHCGLQLAFPFRVATLKLVWTPQGQENTWIKKI